MSINGVKMAAGFISIAGVAILMVSSFSSLIFVHLQKRSGDGERVQGKIVSNLSWKDCDGTGNRYFSVSSIKIEGSFDVGTQVKFLQTGTVTVPFTHASTDVTIKFGTINIYSGSQIIDPPKPYPIGQIQLVTVCLVTDELPSGTFIMMSRFRDPNTNILQCLQVTYKLT